MVGFSLNFPQWFLPFQHPLFFLDNYPWCPATSKMLADKRSHRSAGPSGKQRSRRCPCSIARGVNLELWSVALEKKKKLFWDSYPYQASFQSRMSRWGRYDLSRWIWEQIYQGTIVLTIKYGRWWTSIELPELEKNPETRDFSSATTRRWKNAATLCGANWKQCLPGLPHNSHFANDPHTRKTKKLVNFPQVAWVNNPSTMSKRVNCYLQWD